MDEKNWESPEIDILQVDPLLDSLVLISELLGKPRSKRVLSYGLPLIDGLLTPRLLNRAAERAGLTSRTVQRDLQDIKTFLLPAILLLKNKNACVLTRIDNDKANIIYPGTSGEVIVKTSLISEDYTGVVVFIKTAFNYDDFDRKSQISRKGHWFWGTLKLSSYIYRDVIIASIVINIFGILSALFVRVVYDRVVPNNAFDTLWALAIGMGIVFIFDAILKIVRTSFLDTAGKKSDIILSSIIYEHVQALDYSHKPQSIGSFARSVQEFESIRDFIASTSMAVLVDLPFVVLYIVVIAALTGSLALVPTFLALLIIIISFSFRSPMDKAIKKIYEATAKKNGMLIETLIGLEIIKNNCMEGKKQRDWEQIVSEISIISNYSRLLASYATTISTFLQQTNTIAIIVLGVYAISAGNLTMGGLIAAMMLSGKAMGPLAQMASLITRYSQTKEAYQSISQILALPSERDPNKRRLSRPEVQGLLELKNVSFNHKDAQIRTLNNISLTFKPGEKIAILGRIGSGKTTLMRLINGLYKPTDGMVSLDGLDTRQLDIGDLRTTIACVEQTPLLFQGSIIDNITSGVSHYTEEDLLVAAKNSGVLEFSHNHPEGMDRIVGENGQLMSVGQRQCISIARALMRKPKVLIMDEPTSALDSKSEKNLVNHLKNALPNITILIFTQRMAVLDLVNRIIILDKGSIINDDTKQNILTNSNENKTQETL